ncbi:MAG: alkaline phosphatase family protein [Calditrichia bacterium]|nr:alkaline phosphatase family protein [Calditrichia bacterium]
MQIRAPSSIQRQKVFVIGIDCAEPSLVFGSWRDDLPNLKKLMQAGTYGKLESCIPCITVPAWACMLSGKDPGQLGLYGFHNRVDHSYQRMRIANSKALKAPLIWDYLSRAGREVVVVGVPPSYPPWPVNGVMVGCFLTPDTNTDYTYPASVAQELKAHVGEYPVDVLQFRTLDKEHLLKQVHDMTDKHFSAIEYFMKNRSWEFFMFVEIGMDRIHHGMWRYHDSTHPGHEPDSPYRTAIYEYYRYIDERIGKLLDLMEDDTAVLVVSDHGCKQMKGGICINEWLIQEGYLVLKEQPDGTTQLEDCEVDWQHTRAWGGGGYYGRVFLNVRGREPQGVIDPSEYERIRDELAEKLESLTDPEGRPMSTRAFRPQDIYRECRGIPPDLIVYFSQLEWRSIGTVGSGQIYTFENDRGPDSANHSPAGMLIYYDPRRPGRGYVSDTSLLDIGPGLMHLMGLPIPKDLAGRIPPFMLS